MKLLFFIALIMTAFAANSVLTRLAMASNSIGPSNFALLRAGSGALVIFFLVLIIQKKIPEFKFKTIISALILFAGSMLVMFSAALILKEKIPITRFVGVLLSLLGLYILTDPRFSGNNLFGIILMFLASFSWGIYSVLGHGQKNPLSSTAGNFILAFFLIIPISLFIPDKVETNSYGFILAIISGSITSGIGYTLWYWVLPKIKITTASIAQLTVPLIAAFGGYLFISETLNWQFYISSILILGGISLSFIYKK